MYKLIQNSLTNVTVGIRRIEDAACIPLDLANTDYRTYLKWLDGYELVGREWIQTAPEGNTPLPADQG